MTTAATIKEQAAEIYQQHLATGVPVAALATERGLNAGTVNNYISGMRNSDAPESGAAGPKKRGRKPKAKPVVAVAYPVSDDEPAQPALFKAPKVARIANDHSVKNGANGFEMRKQNFEQAADVVKGLLPEAATINEAFLLGRAVAAITATI